jgi:hypothetical protein
MTNYEQDGKAPPLPPMPTADGELSWAGVDSGDDGGVFGMENSRKQEQQHLLPTQRAPMSPPPPVLKKMLIE